MKLLNSIGKKIFLIVFLSLIVVVLLVFVSLAFFGKIGEISKIEATAFKYEIMVKDVSMEFEKFATTNDNKHYSKAMELLTVVSATDGRLGALYSLLEQGNSVKQAVEIHMKNTGDAYLHTQLSATLVNSIMGTDLVKRLIGTTRKANGLTLRWKELLEQYKAENASGEKEKILSEIRKIDNQLPGILVEFHSVMGDIGAYFSGKIRMLFLVMCVFAIVLIGLVAFFISRTITGPLKQTVELIRKVSDGDFRDNVSIKSNDELGVMVDSVNAMNRKLSDMIREIISGISQLNSSSSRLAELSEQVSQGAENNSKQAHAVSASAEEMTTNINSVAAAMEQSSMNVSTVASAADEMTSTINEIAQNAERARVITLDAVGKAGESTEMMHTLGNAADGIGKVLETITEISEQVNLLSLNATIEAARAGEAGKGFAVVANEIKDLAKQTSEASMDIKTKIVNIQASSKGSLSSIETISSVISEVNEFVSSIATAVEEQSSATTEIAKNIAMVSNGIEEVNGNVNQNTVVVNEITQDINLVTGSSRDISEKSGEVKESARDLSELSVRLDGLVKRFKI